MKNLKYTTMAGRTLDVKFSEDAFFSYMRHCGIVNLKIQNQVSLYINNLHESLFDVPYDSVQFIKYKFSEEFKIRYSDINDVLKYDL